MAKKKGGAKGNATNAPAKKAGALSEADQAAIAAKIAALSAGEQAAAAAVAGLYAGTPEERATAAAALAAATKADKKGAVFVYAIVAYSNPETEVTLVDKLKDMLSGADANARAGALVGIAAVANEMGHSVEPFMLPLLQSVLECYADKQKFVKDEADVAGRALLEIMSPFAAKFVLGMLFESATSGGNLRKWEVQVAALNMIGTVVAKAPEQTGQVLSDAVTCTSDLMNASKKQVAEAAEVAMAAACSTSGNRDIDPFIPQLIALVTNLEAVQDTIHGLAATVFMQ